MKLYALLLPKAETCLDPGLYYHCEMHSPEKVQMDIENQKLLFDKNAFANFDSYYNSFSIEKWCKYTLIENLALVLRLKGKFIITLKRIKIAYRQIIDEPIASHTVEMKEKGNISFQFPLIEKTGIFAFSLQACEDGATFYGGEYRTEVDPSSLREVNIAITMCTFHREAYIQRNLCLLEKSVFSNKESPLCSHLRLYIADNGQSLKKGLLENEFVKIFPQESYGGAGGFVRGILEILKSREENRHTHILIMDDDVIIEPEGLVRNYTLLCLLRPEYYGRQIGGAMLRTDIRYIQYELAGQFQGFGIRSIKPNRDLRDLMWVLDNEKEETHNYQAWFYSCIPIDTYLEKGFSLPFFMKGDDVEYGLRQDSSITLNGIAVWHEPFESKDSYVSKYFCVRNETIVGCMHGMLSKKRVLKELRKALKWHLLCYQYKALDMHYRALEDFCRGVDWLKELNARQYYAELQDADYQRVPIEDLGMSFDYETMFANIYQGESKWRQWFRRLTLNGWFFPANKDTVVSMTRCRIINFYRVKKVLFYNDYTGKGYISGKSYKQFFKAIAGYFKIRRLINKKFEMIKREYSIRKKELTVQSFWEKYLNLESE